MHQASELSCTLWCCRHYHKSYFSSTCMHCCLLRVWLFNQGFHFSFATAVWFASDHGTKFAFLFVPFWFCPFLVKAFFPSVFCCFSQAWAWKIWLSTETLTQFIVISLQFPWWISCMYKYSEGEKTSKKKRMIGMLDWQVALGKKDYYNLK